MSTSFHFEAGKPACPVACKYCFVTEHDSRREVWNANPLAGVNKACTYINVPPWIEEDTEAESRFFSFPWEVLRGDFVGFTAITDPLWPKLGKYLECFLGQVSPLAKAVTCVSKWPISREQMGRLAQYSNLYLVVGITGNEPPIESVSVRKHLETLALAREYGVHAIPIVHPYIAGISDLGFLPELAQLGYREISVKGLRYCDAQMRSWMPEESRRLYIGREDEEVLPEDGWREKVEEEGLKLLSPKDWYLREALGNEPHLPQHEAEALVKRVFELANVTSSASATAVFEAAVRRRL
jgi:DNA repair photolyase